MGPIEDVGMRISMALTLVTAGVIAGPPISGAIVDGTGSFKNVGYYGGTSSLSSAGPRGHRLPRICPYYSERRFCAVVIGGTYGWSEALYGEQRTRCAERLMKGVGSFLGSCVTWKGGGRSRCLDPSASHGELTSVNQPATAC